MIARQFDNLTKEQAIELAESKFYLGLTDEQIVKFQLYQAKLCMPFNIFHKAVEKVLDRPVFTHEFAWHDRLMDEFEGKREKPTFEEVINLIPEEKRIIISTEKLKDD